MHQRLKRAIRLRAKHDSLQGVRASAQCEHLLAPERDADRTLQLKGRHDCKEQLILRSQTRAKSPTDKRRKNADVVVRQTENPADISVDVQCSLGLVVNG